ncbi:DUF2946 domain-containing protein [Dyella sp. C9]|uniref:DUF2946 domain-containing protein n=1 Tax=Dyella sp. C9 TaxID=2202154 RepID=UPI0013002BA1|nr:DUF2946 domain-containing protein [Dyella sp. C9]
MNRRRTPRRFAAWLAVAALWLLVAAPTLTRALPPAWAWPDLGAWCTGHGLSEHHPDEPSRPDAPAGHVDQCGYCVLLGHSPLLGGGAPVLWVVAWLPSLPLPAVESAPWHARLLLSTNPRGPPSVLPA